METLANSKGIPRKAQELLVAVNHAIHRFLPTADVLLYGSVSRSTQGPQSDYDILILTDEPLTHPEEDPVDDALYTLALEQDVVIAPIFFTKHDWNNTFLSITPFHNEVERDAILL